LPDFFKVFGEYKIDILQIRKIFDLGETAYVDKDLTPFLAKLSKIRTGLLEQCGKRGTIFLSPSFDAPGPGRSNSSFILLPLVLRYVSPTIVWKEDFDWRNETYAAYCKRTGWRKSVFKMMFQRLGDIEKNIENTNRSLGYDVS
jgi:hypothetical protein